MEKVLRSSEFWVAVIAAAGQGGVTGGLWTAAEFDQILRPALVYVAARVISKTAKSISFNAKPEAK